MRLDILLHYFILISAPILIIRCSFIGEARRRALDLIHKKSMILFHNKRYVDFWPLYESYGCFSKMLFALGKWNFKDFYSGFEEELNKMIALDNTEKLQDNGKF